MGKKLVLCTRQGLACLLMLAPPMHCCTYCLAASPRMRSVCEEGLEQKGDSGYFSLLQPRHWRADVGPLRQRLFACEQSAAPTIRIVTDRLFCPRTSRTIWIASSCDGATTIAKMASDLRFSPLRRAPRSSRRHTSSAGRR